MYDKPKFIVLFAQLYFLSKNSLSESKRSQRKE